MIRTEYLIDLLATASIESPAANYVDVERMILAREVETAIFQHPPSSITFSELKIGKQAKLHFACGIKEVAWPLIKNEVLFSIRVESATEKILFEAKLHPRKRDADCGWHQQELDLRRFEGQFVRFVFQTAVGWRRSTEYAWAGWANPRIIHQCAATPVIGRTDRYPHIFLLTADALPARYLGCYGSPRVKTPHLDSLAADGILVEQAWSQSCMTMGSYTSLLTGLHPHEHGVSREWQPFPVSKINLPQALHQHGYHTLFAPSSGELSTRNNDLDRVFDEVLPTYSNPMQDGSVTTRQFIRWFEQRPDHPCFNWIHYFDVHPPSMPPAPWNSIYYADDPTSHQREYLPQDISKVRCVESALILRASMPTLESGQPVAEIIDILDDTVAVLRDHSDHRPDLAEHILNLGTCAMRNQSRAEFAQWLAEQTQKLAAGCASVELVYWLKGLIRQLDNTEADITTWLRDVVDFRYPLAIYDSTITYLDSHISTLISYLKEQGLYDQSLIVFTAPHGEILANPTLPYHHFILSAETLHVPLIVKPPKQIKYARGARVNGVFDLIDLFPTIMDIQGFANSGNIAGVSRWNQLRNGEDIPPHDSFATGLHQLSHSICRPPNLLVHERPGLQTKSFHAIVGGANELLHDTVSGEVHADGVPGQVESLRKSLDEWRIRSGISAP
jgi:hypothetical protein